jgi:peptide/nickel transport system substrate-binding protein
MASRSVLAVVLLAALVAACGGEAPPETLLVAMEQDVRTLDPHRHDDSVTHSVLANVFEPLVTFDPQMRIVPALAEGWSNPSDVTWRFKLRPRVRFHDGQPLTARDAKFSLERARRFRAAPHLESLVKIDAVDDATLEIGTSVPEPVLLNKLAGVGIVPAGTPEEVTVPIGTAAYSFVSWEPGKDLRLVANDRYWGGAPPLREARFRVLPDASARAGALARGELHLARELKRKDLEGVGSRVRFVSHPGLVVVLLGARLDLPGPLRSRDVRKAIYLAIDPQELVESSGVEATPVDQVVPPSIFGYLPDGGEPRPDRERARELLHRAGLGEGFDVTLDMAEAFAPNVGRVLAEQLGRVGIRTTVVGLPWSALSARLERGESPFFSIGWSCNGDASHLFDALLHTREGRSWGVSNFGGYANPLLDEAIERAGAILSPSRRLEALHEAMRIVLDDLPLIPLFNRRRTYGVDARLRFEPRLNGQVILRELSWGEAPEPGPEAGTARPGGG